MEKLKMNYIEERPWGQFENIFETSYCKVKCITVKPGGRLSYQFHYKRSERWVIEVQTGEYFGEDDIVRLDDIYGRV